MTHITFGSKVLIVSSLFRVIVLCVEWTQIKNIYRKLHHNCSTQLLVFLFNEQKVILIVTLVKVKLPIAKKPM